MKSTLPALHEVASWSAAVGCDGFKVQWLVPYGIPAMEHEVLPHDKQVLTMLQKLVRQCRSLGLVFDYPAIRSTAKLRSVFACRQLYSNSTASVLFALRRAATMLRPGKCRQAGFALSVSADGTLHPCCDAHLPLVDLSSDEITVHNVSRMVSDSIRRFRCRDHWECRECRFYHSP